MQTRYLDRLETSIEAIAVFFSKAAKRFFLTNSQVKHDSSGIMDEREWW